MTAYFIVEVDVTDPAVFEEYRKGAHATVVAHGGSYVVRGGALETVEGGWQPARLVILAFPTMARLKGWYNSPDYVPLRALRFKSARSRAIMVEGAD
jgi:uncharacterized protein (DUF1330 family)